MQNFNFSLNKPPAIFNLLRFTITLPLMNNQNRRLPPRSGVRHRKTTPLAPKSPLSSSRRSSSSDSSRTSSAVRSAARSVAGAFVACFTPPEQESVSDSPRQNKLPSNIPPTGNRANTGKNGSKIVRVRTTQLYRPTPTRAISSGDVKFTIEQIYKATGKFSPSLKIGQGGFGTVYKGTLDEGTLVAIKRAKKGARDNHMGIEYQREIQMLRQVEHLNLVQLHGFLEEGDEKILVVEFVPNGNLREHLDGKRGELLDFSMRLDIAIDVAHAITYLHTYTDQPIIHRDIKSSNILLTNSRRAKVADFGFARLAADRDSDATHVSTQIKGTAGYLDPEYIKTYQLTDKSDVYSFGVLLVELVTGRRAIESKEELKKRVTAKWAVNKCMEGNAISVLDPSLERNAANNWALEKILQLALQCLAPQRNDRPSMKRCAEILWTIRKEYKDLLALSQPRISSETEQ